MPDVDSGEELEKENSELETEEPTEEEAEFLTDEAGQVDEPVVGRDPSNSKPVTDPNSITLPSGKAMRMAEAVTLTAHRKHKIILLAGAHKSGKTSLISDIFVSFQQGEFSNLLFAGSTTLMGFEERCWTARTIAMPQVPQTKRTSRQDPTYLQLSIVNAMTHVRKDFLICDISGEVFEDAANSDDASKAISDVAWVDHFVLVMDGEKLASVIEREFVVNQAKQILFRLLDTDMLAKNVFIEIVFSKADKIVGDTKTAEFMKHVAIEFRTAMKSRGVHAEFLSTSAHNIYGEKDKPFDLKKLLTRWMSKDKTYQIEPQTELPSMKARNELERFAFRQGAKQ